MQFVQLIVPIARQRRLQCSASDRGSQQSLWPCHSPTTLGSTIVGPPDELTCLSETRTALFSQTVMIFCQAVSRGKELLCWTHPKLSQATGAYRARQL